MSTHNLRLLFFGKEKDKTMCTLEYQALLHNNGSEGCFMSYFVLPSLRPCHTLPDSANGRVTDSKIISPFVSVRMRFSCGECVPCQVMSVLSGLIRWQVLNMFKTSNGRHRIKMSGG